MGKEGALAAALAGLLVLGVARAVPQRGEHVDFDGGGRALGSGERRVLGLPLDLNAATADELESLPGVGQALAARIVAERTARGRFRSLEDLARVPGIGPGKLRLLAGRAAVQPER